ncbi:MAG: CDP-glycerol glycerophosphotransferase family protein [Desulfuromonadales bacterium]|nr:CDP-glycerol glycerophosphotransferase family protein [Desulfuromonadales bacterium]
MPLRKLIKEAFLSIFDGLFYLFSCFVPKSPMLWVFGSMFGGKYADNSKYFFEFVVKSCPDIRPVWITGSKEVATALAADGREVYLFYSLRGIWLSMRAGVGMISHSVVRDIRPFVLNRKAVLVNLWHGIPLKKIAKDDDVSDLRNKKFFTWLQWLAKLLCPGFARSYDLVIACSQEDRRSFGSAFATPLERIRVTGYPRNDRMFQAAPVTPLCKGKKVGIYMPTFRGQEGGSFDFFEQFGFDVDVVNATLERLEVHLYLKLHHFNLPDEAIIKAIDAASSLSFYSGDDVYEDLSAIDFLVTDYSSIYFDYLLLNKPVIFAPFDFEDYVRANRAFYYNYDEVTPGPKAMNWNEVCCAIENAITNPQEYASVRESVRNRFHAHCDGGSSQRVVGEVFKHLELKN